MTQSITEKIRLTSYSHGAGCGCKIAPGVLEEMLSGNFAFPDKNLLVGNSSKDDAAVYDLGNGTAIISTTDFFMPIVDDPFQFGRIAAANRWVSVFAINGAINTSDARDKRNISKISYGLDALMNQPQFFTISQFGAVPLE